MTINQKTDANVKGDTPESKKTWEAPDLIVMAAGEHVEKVVHSPAEITPNIGPS